MGLIILLLIIFLGSIFFSIFKPQIKTQNTIPYAFILGSSIGIPLLYLTSLLTKSIFIGITVWLILIAVLVIKFKDRVYIKFSRKNIFLFLLLIFVSFYFFQRSFIYTSGQFLIASNIYADMGAHIPIIRSFSMGNNFPFEIPFFGESNLTYHFLFDFYTASLEASNLRIDIAYNLISALVISSLFFIFIDVGKNIFGKRSVGFLAFILFVFPSDLSIINVKNIWSNNLYNFSSFLGPSTVGNFLYFNSYLNQRHLLFALALSLVIFLIIFNLTKKKNIPALFIAGGIVGLLPFWNVPIFLIMSLFVFCLFLLFRKGYRYYFWFFAPLMLFSLPQIYLISLNSLNRILFNPGFLISNNFSIPNFFLFWFMNLGIAIITIIGGVIVLKKGLKKVFIALIPVFLIPNLFQFTKDIFDAHKFFNFWFMFMCFFSASFIIYLFNRGKFLKVLSITIFCLSIISGIAEFMVIKNDVKTQVPDYSKYEFIKKANVFILGKKTILTNGEIYDPYLIAGGKIYLGNVHHIYTYGGDPDNRIKISNFILYPESSDDLKKAVLKSGLQYVIIYKDNEVKNLKNVNLKSLNKYFKKVYETNFGILYKI